LCSYIGSKEEVIRRYIKSEEEEETGKAKLEFQKYHNYLSKTLKISFEDRVRKDN